VGQSWSAGASRHVSRSAGQHGNDPMVGNGMVAGAQHPPRIALSSAQKPPKSRKPAISDECAVLVGAYPMKFALFLLFTLAAVTGTAALLSFPMQALCNEAVGPFKE
jgi:hypothetical protein